jgi:hypothetical protein
MISKLVIVKLINYDPNLFNKLDANNKKMIENVNAAELNDEIWNIHFDLKAD